MDYILEIPLKNVKEECRSILNHIIKSRYNIEVEIKITKPPKVEMGDLSFECFSIAKLLSITPLEVVNEVVNSLKEVKFNFISEVYGISTGYINFKVNYTKLGELTFNAIEKLNEQYGFVKSENVRRIIIEHTSANPIRPLHIGNARNAIIGDTLYRLLKSRGHNVMRHFYIDDVGLQVAMAAYGYDKLGRPKPNEKTDEFIGLIYATVNCILEIKKLKEEIKKLKETNSNNIKLILDKLDEWINIAANLNKRNHKLFNKLLDCIERDSDPFLTINNIVKLYEERNEETVRLIREVCELSLNGFRKSLKRINIEFDSWDWESEITIWSGMINSIIEALKSTQYVYNNGALVLDTDRAAEALNIKSELKKMHIKIPPLTLIRSDGTTLYVTRDIAYSLWKFNKADMVINVIGVEQTIPQIQLKIALYLLGKKKEAENLIHYGHEMVQLGNGKMSSRKGKYITLDQIIDEAIIRSYNEIDKRSRLMTEIEKRKLAEKIGVGAIRYAFISISANKPIIFTWDRVLDFNRNSAPFIQYAYARAHSIISKSGGYERNAPVELLKEDIEQRLIVKLAEFPEVVIDATDNLRPEIIANYCNDLAESFNTFYDKCPVLTADSKLRNARLRLVNCIKIVLRNGLNILGIEAPEVM
ncbi:MAG: arginine--tRNA ligase [Candidatus Methanomethylicia archaeon]